MTWQVLGKRKDSIIAVLSLFIRLSIGVEWLMNTERSVTGSLLKGNQLGFYGSEIGYEGTFQFDERWRFDLRESYYVQCRRLLL